MNQPQYLFEARSKPSLPWHEVPLIRATQGSVKGYGSLVHDPAKFDIAITRWPQQGWRPIDQGTGDEGGFVEGTFCCDWKGDVLYGKNDAVSGHYVLGRSTDPQHAQTMEQTKPRDQVLLWHMNYHPDGGQLFFRSTRSHSSCRWLCRATISAQTKLSRSGATGPWAYISTRAFGTKGYFRRKIISVFWIVKEQSMPASVPTSVKSLVCTCPARCTRTKSSLSDILAGCHLDNRNAADV